MHHAADIGLKLPKVTKDDSELLILLVLFPKGCYHRHELPHLLFCHAEDQAWALCMLGKHLPAEPIPNPVLSL